MFGLLSLNKNHPLKQMHIQYNLAITNGRPRISLDMIHMNMEECPKSLLIRYVGYYIRVLPIAI